jgi:hypothetical protein
MGARTARPSTPVIVGLIGGALLVIGSFLTWASMSVNVGALAALLGVDEAVLQGAIPGETSRTLSGMTSPADGVWTLVAGLVVLAAAIVVAMRAELRLPAGVAMAVAGVVGVGWTVYDFTQINDVRDEALGTFAAALQGAGVDVAGGEGLIDVSAGIGLWVALVGGVVALIVGVMVSMSARSAVGASVAGVPATSGGSGGADDMGFGAGTPPVPTESPAPAPATVVPSPPPPPPTDPAASPGADMPSTVPPATDPPATDPPATDPSPTDPAAQGWERDPDP